MNNKGDMMNVGNDTGLMKMCRLAGAEIAAIASKHLGDADQGAAPITFGREVAKKALMQAAALQTVFLSELEKEEPSAAYSNGAAVALCAYADALKKLAMGHVQDEAEGAGKVDGPGTGNEVQDRTPTPSASTDSNIRQAALEEALGLMPVVAKEHFHRTDLTEEFLNGLAYGAAAYAAEVKKLLGQGRAQEAPAAPRLVGTGAPDPLPAIQLLRVPIVAAVRSGQLTPEYSSHLQRKLRRVERLATELTCSVAGFLKSTANGEGRDG